MHCPHFRSGLSRMATTLMLACVVASGSTPVPIVAQVPPAEPDYWPTSGWRTSSPEAQGMDSRTLAAALRRLLEQRASVHDVLIVRHGRVVLDAPFYPYRSGELHDVASVTKSITSTLVGIALAQERLRGVRQRVLPIFGYSGLAYDDARKEALTIEDFLTMSSGMSCRWEPGEVTLEEMQHAADWIRFMLDQPMAADPGSTFAYCSPGMHVLSGVLTRVTGLSALDLARRDLFGPLGIREAIWPADPHGNSRGWGDLHLLPRDMAKLGFLWLDGGRWEGKQLLPLAWMAAATRPHIQGTGWAAGNSYGYGFWVDSARTTFAATGRGGQRIRVTPGEDLIVVLVGSFDGAELSHAITASVKSNSSLPENPGGRAELDSAVAAAARPPTARMPPHSPPLALAVSGRTYLLDDNPLGVKSLALTFAASAEARLRLEFRDGRTEQRPVGLDGVPRVSPGGRFGLPVALSGAWQGDDTFTIYYDEVANINVYRLQLKFSAKTLMVDLEEQTGLFKARIDGRRSD